MQISYLPSTDSSMALASVHGDLCMAGAARQMRRLFAPLGAAVCQYVLAATDVDEKSKDASGDDDFEAWVAYRKAKRMLAKNEGSWGNRNKLKKV